MEYNNSFRYAINNMLGYREVASRSGRVSQLASPWDTTIEVVGNALAAWGPG